MLQDFREQKNSPIIAILFGLIIIVFVLMFGLPSARDSCASQKNVTMAKINGQTIDQELTRSMILRYEGTDIFGTQRYPVVLKRITEGVGTVYLLADEARKAGLRVSDEELADYIQNWESNNPDVLGLGFLYKNQFMQRTYEDGLRRIQMSTQNYEDYKRKELLARRYLILMQSSLNVSEEALWHEFEQQFSTATIKAIRLTPNDVRVTLKPLAEEEISAFEKTGMADIQQYYDAHIRDYTAPAKAQLQQVTIQKDASKLLELGDKLGIKTDKTYQPNNRFNIAKAAFEANPDNFDQFFEDYDESEYKDNKGMTSLLELSNMDQTLQDAIKDLKAGETFSVELSNRYMIGKVVKKTEEVVTPLDEVKHDIARLVLEDRRIKSRTSEVASSIIAQAKLGKSLEDALKESLYANVLDEQPMIPSVDENAGANAETAENADANAGTQMVAIPTELPIVPESSRVQVKTYEEVSTSSGFIAGLGISDNMARDIRENAAGTILPNAYEIGQDTVITFIEAKQDASKESFNASLNDLREVALQKKAYRLIGDINGILQFNGEYGVWVEQLRANAKANGTFYVNDSYLNELTAKYADKKK